jgi:hypothetical protein
MNQISFQTLKISLNKTSTNMRDYEMPDSDDEELSNLNAVWWIKNSGVINVLIFASEETERICQVVKN